MSAHGEPAQAELSVAGSNGVPSHVAIIMDGNGRWANARGMSRTQGHRHGVEAVRAAVKAAGQLGITTLTLFSFSSENWSRPASEVSELMGLLKLFIRRDLAELHKENIRIRVMGTRRGVPDDVLPLIEEAENLTRNNTGRRLVIAFNYGGRDEIVRAARELARKAAAGEIDPNAIDEAQFDGALDSAEWEDPDLIIRTSGEMRISNFLLWQSAYSEFVFLDCLWPDFDQAQFEIALAEYAGRTRRFGGVMAKAAP